MIIESSKIDAARQEFTVFDTASCGSHGILHILALAGCGRWRTAELS